jgi:hypothetical protein
MPAAMVGQPGAAGLGARLPLNGLTARVALEPAGHQVPVCDLLAQANGYQVSGLPLADGFWVRITQQPDLLGGHGTI